MKILNFELKAVTRMKALYALILCLLVNTGIAFAQTSQAISKMESTLIYIGIGLGLIFIVYGIFVINQSVQVMRGFGQEPDWFGAIPKCLHKNRTIVSFLFFLIVLIGIYFALTYTA
ncbi:MAG: hypothetical protein LC109_13430 [Bacteroidia bacterium]|nr:hypothetical protein [Bacteroidia bacterium]MCO5254987.1 hypothetical protein [Bacteroidota bacterium]MCZ2131250.1 hypothetical protein [Bacteroidia bacterium]